MTSEASLDTCSNNKFTEVVEALAGELKWSLDLLAWIFDCLFELMGDDKFMEQLNGQKLVNAAEYLQEKNEVALHLLLCSSTRSFLSALCRRVAHLDGVSAQAVEFYRRQAAEAEHSGVARLPSGQLQQAYQRMQQAISSSLVPAAEFERMLNTLGADIKQAYSTFLPAMLRQATNPPQGKQIDLMIKTSQIQMELMMLLTRLLPPPFTPLIKKFFVEDLKAMRERTDPARLFFANFSALGVQDDQGSLAAKVARGGAYYDIFKRAELRLGTPGMRAWRRCVRCPLVMEDAAPAHRPGVAYVLSQQRKCSCGGSWGLLGKGKLIL